MPIQLYGLEGRYAHAIYSAAVKQKSLDAVDKDFKSILVKYKENPKIIQKNLFLKDIFTKEKGLNELLRNPLLTKDQRQSDFMFY